MAHRYREPGFSDGIQLYVKFLPLECNEDDLYELFSQYGEVLSATIPQKSYTMGGKYLYGYVTYSSKSDAMDAILELNDTPPYYLTVEVSRCGSAELLREQIQTIPSGLQYEEHTAPVPRRHSTMAHNYKLTTTLDGRRTIRGLPSVEQRRSLPFSKGCGREVQDPLEDDDVPAPGQKQKFPCFKCGNLTFRKCVCGGAYYCKDECRLSDWPEHKPVCLKKLESQPEFQAETASGSLTSPERGSARSQLGFRKGQIENGIQSQQNVNLGPRQSRFPALDDFASAQTTESNRLSNFPARNDLDSVQDYKFSDMKESSDNQYPNDGSMSNEHGDFTNKQNQSRKNNWDNNDMRIDSHPSGGQNRRGMDGGDNWKEADVKNNHMLGQNQKYIQGDSDRRNDNLFKRGDGKKNVSQRDGDIGRSSNQDDSGRNVNQYSGDKSNFSQLNDDRKRIVGQGNGDNRINYGQGDGDRRNFCQGSGDRKNFNQGSGDRKNFNQGSGDRRNLSQGSGDNKRNFCHRDGVKKNFSQDGENRRNFGQHDGDKNKFGDRSNARNDSSGRRTFGSRDHKPFSSGMNEKKGNDWNGKHSEGAAHTKLEENEESWDQPIEKKVEDAQCVPHEKIVDAQSFPQEKVEGIQPVSVEKLQKIHVTATLDSKIPPLGAFTSKDLPAEVAQVLIVLTEGPRTFFVQRLSNGESLKLICEEVVKSPSLPLAKPEIGMLCAAMFEGEWYRACVLSVTPQLTVKYVDYGNVDICDPSELHELPASIVDLPPVAEKIEVVDASPGQCLKLSEGAVISIKPIEKAKNGILKVTIIDGKSATITKIDAKTESSQGSAIAKKTRPIVTTSLQAESPCAVPVLPPEVNAASVAPSSCTEGVPPVASAVQAERTSPTAIKVAVVMKEKSNTYFVQRVANNDTLRMICEEVVKSPSLPLIVPEVGKRCASMFEGEWYRAQILMLDPNLAVQYIDYGNVDICDPTTLHELSPSILSLPPMAEKIKFVDEIPVLSDDAIISIIPTGETEKGVMKVRLDGGKNAAVSTVATADESLQGNAAAKDAQLTTDPLLTEETSHPTASVASIPASPHITNSIVSPLQEETLPHVASLQQAESFLSTTINSTKDEFMKAKITVLNDKTDYWVTWESDCEKLDSIIMKTHENVTSVPLASPKEGQVCCAKYDGIWFRAKITKTEPEVEVHYFDYGNSEICPINDLRELPEAVKDFPPMAFRVKLADGTPPEYHDMFPDSVLSIKIVGQDDNGVKRVQVEGVKYADILPMSQSALIKSVPIKQVSSSPQENMASNPSKPSTKSTDCGPTANPAASEHVDKLNVLSKFYDVQVSMTLGGNDYWVQRAGMDKELQIVMVEVNEHASKGIKTTPEVGKLCAAQFQSFWYRARITKIAPELEVHFIDFGNTEICTSDILELPSSVKNFTPLALRIQLADGTPAKFSNLPVDSLISIRPVLKTTENITVVRVEGVDYGEGLEENVYKEVASTVETPLGKKQDPGSSNPDFQNTCLKFLTTEGNIGGALHFIKKYSGSYYTVTAVSDASRSVYDQLIELRKSSLELPTDKSFRPGAGDVVLALSPSQGGLCRARVVSENSGTYKVLLVDIGIIESVTEVRELPPHLAALPSFAVKCVVTSYYVKEEEFLEKCAKSEDAFIFQVRSVNSSHVTCLVLSITNSPLCSVVLSAWEPSFEDIGVTRVVLRDGDPVRVSFYNGPEDVHVSSLVPEHVQLFATFSETLHAYCIQAGFLQQPPRVGDVLACKFVDDNRFYRCEVRSVTCLFCDICYLDYGNSEYGVMFNKLKYISEDLKKFACPCLHVSLKGVGSCKMTFELVNFIKKLVDEKVVLRIEKHPDGVVLRTETGVSINEIIVGILNDANPTVVPAVGSPPISCSGSDLKANAANNSTLAEPCTLLQSAVQNHSSYKADSKSRIMSSALKHRKFPLGELKLQIFSILKDLSLMACPFDTSAVEATDNLSFTLNDYCSKLPAEPYHPLVDEVCIAKFHADGQWYRAVCLSAAPSASTRKLMFVDYGNVEDVEVTDIRKMDPQFIELPVLVEKCNIKGVGERNKLVEKIIKEKILTSKLYDIKITKHLPTHYEVEIGLVTAALQAEGI